MDIFFTAVPLAFRPFCVIMLYDRTLLFHLERVTRVIHILTDSTADLSPQQAADWGVEVLPLSVHFGEETFLDGVELSPAAFFERLAQVETLPTTSQIPPDVFVKVFEERLAAGDQVLGLFISSQMSGTCQSAMIAKGMVDSPDIRIIDSRAVTMALGLLVRVACQLRDEGLSLEELSRRVEELTHRVRLLAAVDTLKYLKMGGRISAATAVVGGILGITPIIAVQNGIVESVGKARGRAAAFSWIREELARRPADLSLPVFFGHTNAPKTLEEIMDFFASWHADAPAVHTTDIGSVVGTHVGPGAAGFAYFEAT